MRILIIKLGALGDVVRTTAILPGIRRKFPTASVEWITRKSALPLIEGNPEIARDHVFEGLDPRALGAFDWLISLDDEKEACEFAAKVSAKKVSGAILRDGVPAYTADVEEWFGMGILRPASLGGLPRANELKLENQSSHPEIFYRMLGLPGPIERPQIFLAEEEIMRAKAWLRDEFPGGGKIIGLNTGAGARWKFKSWGADQTAALAKKLAVDGYSVLILGGADERERNAEIWEATGKTAGVKVAPSDLGLREFSALISQLALLVTSDSLALHLGLAAEVPVVTFFGPTSDREITVYGSGEKVVTPLECRGCYLKSCDISPHCMDSIEISRMEKAVRSTLARA